MSTDTGKNLLAPGSTPKSNLLFLAFFVNVIKAVNERETPVVFILWGSYAQKKGQFIDQQRHLVLKAPHPSPLAAHRGFFGCQHFSKTNQYLQSNGIAPITWALEDDAEN